MTEQEIISYLKENKKKGVIFAFMPDDVQNWCNKHFSEHIFSIFVDDKWDNKREILCLKDTVYALSEDYESEQEFKPYWQEFEIDEDGYFYYNNVEFYYRDDALFEKRYNHIFKGFGGWLYKCNDGPVWTTIPHIAYKGELYMYLSLDGNEHEITAPIPTKIRFMRYRK